MTKEQLNDTFKAALIQLDSDISEEIILSVAADKCTEIAEQYANQHAKGLLHWMFSESEHNPMKFETDNEDIVLMYLNQL